MVYGDFPVVGRRVAVWMIAQLHLMFAAFVVGVPLFILIIEIMGAATKSQRYDDLAHEFTRLLSVAFSTTATFGGSWFFPYWPLSHLYELSGAHLLPFNGGICLSVLR